MNYIAGKLEELDKYYGDKSQNEKLLLIGLVAIVVGFVAYLSFFESAEALHKRRINENRILTKKIYSEKTYLKTISRGKDRDYKVKEYDNEIKSKKHIVNIYNEKISIINSSLNKLSDLLFSQESWSLFLNSVTKKASKNSVTINKMVNKYIDSNESFGHVLEIGLNCEGSFKDIVRFINDLEQNTLVTDVYSSKIYTDLNRSIIISDINVSVWGINH